MKVSIITSLYNEAHNLPSLFNSIKAQTFKNFEFLITDDGSTDRTREKLKNYCSRNLNIKIFSQSNKGLTYSLNRMIEEAGGQYIARMDAGDLSYPERIEEQVEYLDQHPYVALVGSWVKVKYKQWSLMDLKYPNNHNFLKKMLMKRRNSFTHGSIMFRKNAIDDFSQPYRFPYSQDFDFLIRISTKGKLAMIEKILYEYHISIDSISFRNCIYQKQFSKLALQNYKSNNKTIQTQQNIDMDVKNIMNNTKEIDKEAARGNFYKFIGNLLLRNFYPKKAKKYYIMSFKNGRKECLLPIYLCNFGKIASKLTNFIGSHFDPTWKYKISCISSDFE